MNELLILAAYGSGIAWAMAASGTKKPGLVEVTDVAPHTQMDGVDSPSLNNSFFLVVGFYFGRTNHQRVGGVEGGR